MVAVQRADPAYVLDLGSLEGGMLGLVGGKAANLGELTRAGFPVPSGFCVTTAAYRRATESTELAQVCADLQQTDPSDASALAARAARAREAVMAAVMPADVAESVAAAYEAMAGRRDEGERPHEAGGADVPVAVRSSATAEPQTLHTALLAVTMESASVEGRRKSECPSLRQLTCTSRRTSPPKST